MVGHGFPEPEAYTLLRTIMSYTLGTASNEVAWRGDEPGCAPDVAGLLRPGTSNLTVTNVIPRNS